MSESKESYKLEQSKVKLAKGGETSIVYAVPSKLRAPSTGVIIAHGAGGPMHSPFIRYFHTELAKRGFLTAKFNFPYMEARLKIPDRTDVLEAAYRSVIEEVSNSPRVTDRLFIGGKSMGGRIASQVAAKDEIGIDGLFFLGYPLHPPGKTDQLRDKHLYAIKKPMLFLSGTRDSFARRDLLASVVEKIGSNAKLHWIEGGDHSLKPSKAGTDGQEGIREAITVLLQWLENVP